MNLEKLTPDGLANLLKNESNKLLLINFWATWFRPCIIEYLEFVTLQRMYGDRDFQFVSVSGDAPDQEEKALKFLKCKGSALPNDLMDTKDKYEVISGVAKD